MRTSRIGTITCGIVLAALMSATTLPASATADAAPSPTVRSGGDEAVQTSTVAELTPEQIAAADEFVTRHGARYVFDEHAALTELDSTVVEETREAIASWNSNVESASNRRAVGHVGYVAMSSLPPVVSGEHGYIKAHWYGLEIKLDSYLVGKVIGGTTTAAGIATAIGLATAVTGVGGVAGSVVAAALSLASGMISLCQDESGSVTYYVTTFGWHGCNPFA